MSAVYPFNPARSDPGRAACQNCGLLSWSRAAALTTHVAMRFNDLITHYRPLASGSYLHRAGLHLTDLCAVHSGFLKTTLGNANGLEQITGFVMPGDLVGMDAIGSGMHLCNTIALENSSVCGISFAALERLCRESPELQKHFHRMLSMEITRDHGIMLLLGVMSAEKRLAVFLLNLSRRFGQLGYSPTRFKLAMTRDEIGSYLGLSLETVSRTLSKFNKEQLITVSGKEIRIKNLDGLEQNFGDYKQRRSPHDTVNISSSGNFAYGNTATAGFERPGRIPSD